MPPRNVCVSTWHRYGVTDTNEYLISVSIINMKDYLSNGIIEIEVSNLGAELQSLRKVSSPYEYLWQGDPAFWNRRAPILFPIVGKVWDNTAHIDGGTYELHQHGFARDMKFRKIVDEDRHLAYELVSDEETRSLFPRDFRLRVDYTILRNVLTVKWTVENTGKQLLAFQIGAHPAFNYPRFHEDDEVHGFFSFDADSPLVSTTVAGGYATDDTFDVPLGENDLLPLTNNTFSCDTILEATGRIHRVTMHDPDGKPYVTVLHEMPITALWSPNGGCAPFVCIEPWHGRCDRQGFAGEFDRRPFVEHVQPGWTWDDAYQIIVE